LGEDGGEMSHGYDFEVDDRVSIDDVLLGGRRVAGGSPRDGQVEGWEAKKILTDQSL
jgi:hypothetical protein